MRKILGKFVWLMLGAVWLFIGCNWALAKEFEPIHSKIIDAPWEDVPKEYQELILFLMKVCCGMCLGIGLITIFFVIGPLKKIWCCTNVYLFILNIVSLAPLTMVNLNLRFNRHPNILEPNWIIATSTVGMAVLAFALGYDKCVVGKCPCLGGGKKCCGGKGNCGKGKECCQEKEE